MFDLKHVNILSVIATNTDLYYPPMLIYPVTSKGNLKKYVSSLLSIKIKNMFDILTAPIIIYKRRRLISNANNFSKSLPRTTLEIQQEILICRGRYLQNCRVRDGGQYSLHTQDIINMAIQVAVAGVFLHTNGFYHKDLAARNCV